MDHSITEVDFRVILEGIDYYTPKTYSEERTRLTTLHKVVLKLLQASWPAIFLQWAYTLLDVYVETEGGMVQVQEPRRGPGDPPMLRGVTFEKGASHAIAFDREAAAQLIVKHLQCYLKYEPDAKDQFYKVILGHEGPLLVRFANADLTTFWFVSALVEHAVLECARAPGMKKVLPWVEANEKQASKILHAVLSDVLVEKEQRRFGGW